MAAATAYLFEELATAVGREDAVLWLRDVVRRAKLNTAARAGRCADAATDPKHLPARHHAAPPSARRPAHAAHAQAPTETGLASEDARACVKGWHRQWRSSGVRGVLLQTQDRSQETKAEGPREGVVKRAIVARQHDAWQRRWKSCGALHELRLDAVTIDGTCEPIAAFTGVTRGPYRRGVSRR